MISQFTNSIIKAETLLILIIGLSIGGCALPPEELERQSFVPRDDVVVASLVREGLYYFRRGRLTEAEEKLRQAQHMFPLAPNIRINLALVLAADGQYVVAQQMVDDLLDEQPDELEYLFARARVSFLSGDYKVSDGWYNRAFEIALLDERFELASQAASSIASLRFRIGDEAGALCYSALALELRSDVEQLYRHARLLVALGQFQQAQQLLLKPNNDAKLKADPRLKHLLGLIYWEHGKLKESLALEQSVSEVAIPDALVKAEVSLVSTLLQQLIVSSVEEGGQGSGTDGAVEDSPQEIELTELLLDDELLTSPAALYWPSTVLLAVEKKLQSQVEED